MKPYVRQTEPFRWEGIPVSAYKSSGTHFSGITRQVVFPGGDGLACELRYFEIEPDGYSSLERHRHAHAIMVIRGRWSWEPMTWCACLPSPGTSSAPPTASRWVFCAWWTAKGISPSGPTRGPWQTYGPTRPLRNSYGREQSEK
jgi:hypothetical protein